MEKFLDRDLQRKALQELARHYPEAVTIRSLRADFPDKQLDKNLVYLMEHGLIRMSSQLTSSGRILGNPSITHKGMDFLEDDGGLSAILETVTIKLHEDTIKRLIIQKVEESQIDRSTKGRLIDAIKSLPAEATKEAVLGLVSTALQNPQTMLIAFHKLIGTG